MSSLEREEFVGKPASDGGQDVTSHWWTSKPEEMHRHVLAVVAALEGAQAARRARRLRMARMYANADFAGFGPGEHQRIHRREERLTDNAARSVVDTVCARISKDKPKPLFLTSGGEWSLQRQAKGLTKYVEGGFESIKLYDHAQRAFRDSCVVDTAFVKFLIEDDEVKCHRVFADELIVDEDEALYGEPRQIHQRRWMSVERAIAKFGRDAETIRAIRQAGTRSAGRGTSGGEGRGVLQVRITESWHLRSHPKNDDGCRVVCVEGATLFHEKYEDDFLPFPHLYWSPPLVGFYGTSLVEEVSGLQIEYTKLLRLIARAQEGAVPRIFVNGGAQALPPQITDEIWGIVKYVGAPPVFSPTAAVAGEMYQHAATIRRLIYEVAGVSMMSATGKKEPGVDAGVAIRELRDIESGRFALQAQRYEAFFMQCARVYVALSKRLFQRRADLEVKVNVGKYIERIKWSDVDLDADQYVMRAFPVSFLPSDPAGRLQTVKELVKEGFVPDRAGALSLLDFPDLEEFMSLQTAALDDVKLCIESILEKGRSIEPEKYMNLQLALKVGTSALLRAQAQGRDEARCDMLRVWIDKVNALLAPPPSDPTMGAGGPAAPPGAPPGLPPGPPAGMPPVPMGAPLPPPMVPQAPPPDFTG